MMSQRNRRPAKHRPRPRRRSSQSQFESIILGPHHLPKRWRPFDWLVPFIDNQACIQHGHGLADDDHSRCGPALFCCRKAAERYGALFPDCAEIEADWQLTTADHIARWLDKGVPVLYFIFCDPRRPQGLWIIGLSGEPLRQTLYQQLALEAHLDHATRLA